MCRQAISRTIGVFLVYVLVLISTLAAPPAHVQAIEVTHIDSEVYARVAVSCLPPIEYEHLSGHNYSAWADSVSPSIGCSNNESGSLAFGQQITRILADTICVNETVHSANWGPEAQSSHAHSDAGITFLVPYGHGCSYTLTGVLSVENPQANGVDGLAKASLYFFRVVGERGSLIDTLSVQAGPGLPTHSEREFQFQGVLGWGYHCIQGFANAQNLCAPGETRATLRMRLVLQEVVAIAPATFTRVKELYRL
jgi:hypothetical protein